MCIFLTYFSPLSSRFLYLIFYMASQLEYFIGISKLCLQNRVLIFFFLNFLFCVFPTYFFKLSCWVLGPNWIFFFLLFTLSNSSHLDLISWMHCKIFHFTMFTLVSLFNVITISHLAIVMHATWTLYFYFCFHFIFYIHFHASPSVMILFYLFVLVNCFFHFP